MAILYPDTFRADMVATRSGEETPSFRATDPAAGPFFVEPFTDDTVVFYDLEWKFEQGVARAFSQWVHNANYLNKGQEPFEYPLESEAGVTTQVAQFLPGQVPLRPVSQDGGIFTYRGRIIIRDFQNPDDEYSEWLIELGNFNAWADATNQTMNVILPQIQL